MGFFIERTVILFPATICSYLILLYLFLQLYIPGCTYLTADGVVSVVRRLTERKGKLKRLRLRGLCNISSDHLDSLNFYLGINDHPQCSKPSVYNHWKSLPLNDNDDRPIDVDICPKCKNARLVFDCTRENCRLVTLV